MVENNENVVDESEVTDLEKPLKMGPPEPYTAKKDDRRFVYRVLPLNLSAAATTQLEFEIHAEKIYYMEGQSRLRIQMETRGADYIELYPGRKIVCPFKKFFITAPMADEVVKLAIVSPHWIVMHGEGVEVNTLIRSKAEFRETELARSFGGGGRQAAVTAHYSAIQLWNPADSGVICVMRKGMAMVSSGTVFLSAGYTLLEYTTELDSNNKYLALADPNCEVRRMTDSTRADLYEELITTSAVCNSSNPWVFPRHDNIIIRPGRGFCLVHVSSNSELQAEFEWIELPEDNISGFASDTIEIPT